MLSSKLIDGPAFGLVANRYDGSGCDSYSRTGCCPLLVHVCFPPMGPRDSI